MEPNIISNTAPLQDKRFSGSANDRILSYCFALNMVEQVCPRPTPEI
jgi:hypothetical protein